MDDITLIFKEETSIEKVKVNSANANPVGYYTPTGQRLREELQKGFYLIKYDDGTARKVVK